MSQGNGVLAVLNCCFAIAAGGACAVELDGPENTDREDAVANQRDLWPGGDVYLLLDSDNEVPGVRQALNETQQELALNTGIRLHFISDPSESTSGYWTAFSQRTGDVGGAAPIGIRRNGLAHAGSRSVRHEIGHIVGLKHTQNRLDRDENITIHPGMIARGALQWFQISPEFHPVGPYRHDSIVHYTSLAFQNGTNIDGQRCAVLSIGVASPEDCVIADDQFKEERTEVYTDWNYSVMAALYCDPKRCGDRCADAERCETEQVQTHLQRLHDWEDSPEGRRIAALYAPDNLVCGAQVTDSIFPQEARLISDIFVNDCDFNGQSMTGIVQAGHPTWYQYHTKDTAFCNSDPSIDIVAGDVDVCMYPVCNGGKKSATLTCPSGTTNAQADLGYDNNVEYAGCCGSENFSIDDIDCQDSDEDAIVYMQVINAGESNTCEEFSIEYHY